MERAKWVRCCKRDARWHVKEKPWIRVYMGWRKAAGFFLFFFFFRFLLAKNPVPSRLSPKTKFAPGRAHAHRLFAA